MRKTAVVVIDAEGRDKGRTYSLVEMSASQAEKWALRAFLALAKSGVDVPPNIARAGIAGVLTLGLKAFAGVPFPEMELLMDEMFAACVGYIPDPSKPAIIRGAVPLGKMSLGPLVEDDIEEIATRFHLRKEVIGLHVDFSKLGALLTSARASSEDQRPSTSTSPA